MNLNAELLEKAKLAKNPRELMLIAEENSIALTEEEADTYFAHLNPKSGELGDDELSDVSGGCGTTYYNEDGYPIITAFNTCEYWRSEETYEYIPDGGYCKDCWMSYYDGLFLICRSTKRRNN